MAASASQVRWRVVRGHDKIRLTGVAIAIDPLQVIYLDQYLLKIAICRLNVEHGQISSLALHILTSRRGGGLCVFSPLHQTYVIDTFKSTSPRHHLYYGLAETSRNNRGEYFHGTHVGGVIF